TLWMKDPGLDPGLKRSLTPLLCGFAMTRSCSCFPSHKSRVKSCALDPALPVAFSLGCAP
ncbi:MAG: hypothetical protein PHQ51_09270, partial [Synergistales bacterium]|nr:hypothetical protein [Synergistales bacterium]